MALKDTPACEFATPAVEFTLRGVDEHRYTLADCHGPREKTPSMGCSIKWR